MYSHALYTLGPATILGDFHRIPERSAKSSADKMYRACEQKDQILKKIRTLHSSQKDYIHNFLFSELISPIITFQLQENIFWELISPKLHITYLFVIQRITWKSYLELFLGKNLISVT